jgi:hypothetical protein
MPAVEAVYCTDHKTEDISKPNTAAVELMFACAEEMFIRWYGVSNGYH